jgi:hypothetical protein
MEKQLEKTKEKRAFMGNDIESLLMPEEIEVAEFQTEMNFIASDGRTFTDFGMFEEYENDLRIERQIVIEDDYYQEFNPIVIYMILFVCFLIYVFTELFTTK